MTACQQSCPTSAITFGNMKDPESAVVARRHANEKRAYHVLQELNTRPGVQYLAQVRRDDAHVAVGDDHSAEKGSH